jgi:RNA polymerase subunit RPABC4/transcription elongation factor Spt4
MEITVPDAIAVYCVNCDRVVYLGEDDTSVCPVCATPLIVTEDEDGGS